jgi:muramoyltetrapeptide carboxypeptidase
MKLLKPPRLRRGDVIGVIAPASPPPSTTRVQAGVRYLEGLGYRVKPGRHLAAQHGHLAGTDAQRLEDLNAMLRDPQVRAVFALRGGYGTPRLLTFVDYRAVRSQPKIMVGFSDFTALQLALFRRTGLVTFSGPLVAADFGSTVDPFTEEHFWRLVTSSRPVGALANPADEPLKVRRAGRIEGRLLGGNLSLLLSCLGTPFSPDYRGALLVLEDVGEQYHRLDRMFTQLRNAGILSRLAGLVLGRFTACTPANARAPHLTPDQIVDEVLTWFSAPVVEGLAYGHIARKLTLPWGLRARLDTARGKLEVLESAVE